MRKQTVIPVESPWFINGVVPIASAGVGLPVSVLWGLEVGNDWGGIAIAAAPTLFCAVVGYSLFRLILWLGPSIEE